MDIYKMELFQNVAFYKNITKAASVSNVTQATMSRQMQMLEDEIGVKLFVRNPKGVELTAAGYYLYNNAESYIVNTRELINGCRNISNTPFANLRIGTGPYEQCLTTLPIKKLMADYPTAKFNVSLFTYKILTSRFDHQSVEFAFTTQSSADAVGGLKYKVIHYKPWMVAARADNPYWDLPLEAQQSFKNQTVVTTYMNSINPVMIYLAKNHMDYVKLEESNFLSTQILMMQTTNMVSILPSYLKKDLESKGIIMKDILEIPFIDPTVVAYNPDNANEGTKLFMDICSVLDYSEFE